MTISLRNPDALGKLAATLNRVNAKPAPASQDDLIADLRQQLDDALRAKGRAEAELARRESYGSADEIHRLNALLDKRDERINTLSAENKRLRRQLEKGAPSAAEQPTIPVKEFAKRANMSERTLYRRIADDLVRRPDGSSGWKAIGGGEVNEHGLIYADAIVHPPPPRGQKPKKAGKS